MNVRLPAVAPALAGAAAFLALFTAIPALLPGGERVALAQPAAQSDSVKQLARQRYGEGVKAFDAGRYEDARNAFLQAYALTKHPAVLLNLGQSELRSNHPEDAGNHFQQFLREHSAATAEERTTARAGIAEAKKKASQVVVSVDAAGADVSIDGTTVGKSPLPDPVFIKPGKHTVFATLAGKSAAAAIDTKPGLAATATLTLGAGAPAPAPVPAPPSPPTGPSGPPAGPATPPPGMAPITPPMGGPLQPQPLPPYMQNPLPVPEPESFFHWYKRKPIAWVGTGVTGLGLVLGIIGSASASSASSSTNSVADQIRAHRATDPNNPPTAVCGTKDGAGVFPGYENACQTLRDNISTYHTDVALAATGWVLFGLGAAGTALYTFVDWYPNRRHSGAAEFLTHTAVVPVVTPTFRGVGLSGSF